MTEQQPRTMRARLDRHRLINVPPEVFGVVSGVLIVLAALLMTADIITRNIGSRGIGGVVERGEISLVIIVMLGMVFAEHRQAHVSSTVLARYLPAIVRRFALGIGLLASAVVLLWISTSAAQIAWSAYQSGAARPGLARVEVWPARLAVALAMLSVAVQLAVSSVRVLLGQSTRDQPVDLDDVDSLEEQLSTGGVA